MRVLEELRFVLVIWHDVRLGLHWLRLAGELVEIREPDLRFTLAEAEELLAAAGVQLPESALGLLQERTEGWAAGLRLAALSTDPGEQSRRPTDNHQPENHGLSPRGNIRAGVSLDPLPYNPCNPTVNDL